MGSRAGSRAPEPEHPKAARETYRGYLQQELAGRLAGERVVVLGGHLVSVETGEILDCGPGERPELYFAAAHAIAADPRYRWVGYRQGSDARGEAGDQGVPLGGALWSVSDRVDPSYQARLAARARKLIPAAMGRARTRLRAARILDSRRYRLRFLTLTAPSLDSTSRLEEMAFHNRAFERLRSTHFWTKRVWGGVKNLEDSGVERPHVHSHSLVLSDYLPQTALAWAWTCSVVRQRREDAGDPTAFADPLAGWTNKGWTLERVVEVENMLSSIRRKLRDLARPSRRRRTWKRDEIEYWESELRDWSLILGAVRRDCYVVDVRLITDKTGERTTSLSDAVAEVAKYVTKTSDLLKRPQEDLLGLIAPPRAPRTYDSFGACRNSRRDSQRWDQQAKDSPLAGIPAAMQAAEEGAPGAPSASLDTAAILSGEASVGTDPETARDIGTEGPEAAKPPPKPPRRPRGPTWRDLMAELSLSDFILAIEHRAKTSASFALARLKQARIWAYALDQVLEGEGLLDPFAV